MDTQSMSHGSALLPGSAGRRLLLFRPRKACLEASWSGSDVRHEPVAISKANVNPTLHERLIFAGGPFDSDIRKTCQPQGDANVGIGPPEQWGRAMKLAPYRDSRRFAHLGPL